jgi:transposase-like protein
MKKEKSDLEQFSLAAAELLRQGKPLTGKEGVFTALLKQILEKALEAEAEQHMELTRAAENNRRNGYTRKNLKSSLGAFEIFSPRDRSGSFQPQTIRKRQTVLSQDIDEKIISMYGLGMSYGDIQKHLQDMYGVDVSAGLLNSITDKILPVIREWQSRPLEKIYAVVYLDAMYFKTREDGQVVTKCVYSLLGITLEGKKEVLGIYIGEHESVTFWMRILSDLQQRGVQDMLICCIDSLKGFAQAIESVYAQAEVQLCIIHQLRNSFKYVSHKDSKELMADLKKVYKASSKELAEHYLQEAEQKWKHQYAIIFKSWHSNWERLSQYFKYPEPIRRLIYTTNPIESYHRMVRKATKTKGIFSSENAILKQVYLATQNAQARWNSFVYGWPAIRLQLDHYFSNRLSDTVQ